MVYSGNVQKYICVGITFCGVEQFTSNVNTTCIERKYQYGTRWFPCR